jgi:hypothetical protein
MPNDTHAPITVGQSAESVRRAAADFGAKPDTPEGAFIAAIADLVDALDRRVERFTLALADARDLPLASLEASMRRAATAGLTEAAKRITVGASWTRCAALAGVAVVALGVGAAGGWWAGQSTAQARDAQALGTVQTSLVHGGPGAEWLSAVAALNDLADRARWCADPKHVANQAGGVVCQVPLWIKAARPTD